MEKASKRVTLYTKIVDPYFLSCPSYAPSVSYVLLKTKFENLVCKLP